MALRLIEAAPEVLATYRDSLRDYGVPADGETVLYHLPVVSLALDALAKDGFENLRPSGCRFVAAWPDGRWLSCEMTDPTLYGNAAFRNVASGEAAIAVARRIDEARLLPAVRAADYEARLLPAVRAADYEVRLLTVPGLLFEGLYLVGETPDAVLILPTVFCDPELSDTAVLAGSDFLAAASSLAAAQLAYSAGDLSS